MNFEKFVLRGNEKYKYSFSYYQDTFVDSLTKTKITCKNNHDFWIIPKEHIRARSKGGCNLCSIISKTIPFEEFCNRANIKHNYKFLYYKENYLDTHCKTKINCQNHGDFWQIPYHHLNGSQCPACTKKERCLTFEDFKNRANKLFNNKYSYNPDDYTNLKSKINVLCPDHGIFIITPGSHLNNRACKKCFIQNKTLPFKQFEQKAQIKHNYIYNYDQESYINTRHKVKIICSNKHIFWQNVGVHLLGQGCPKCAKSNKSKKEHQWLDLIGIPLEFRNKRITKNLDVDGFDPITNTIYEFYGDFWHRNPKKFNHNEINKVTKKTFGEMYNKTIERENLIKSLGYNLITIWEDEFDQTNKV